MSLKILIAEPIDRAATDWLSEQGAEVLLGYENASWEANPGEIVAVIYRGQLVIDGPYLDRFPSLRVVGKHGVGINTIDLQATTERGITVTNTPGANANSVAEHAILLWLAAARRLIPVDAGVRAGDYENRLSLVMVNELRGTRLGIVGGGRVGRRIAEIARGGFECEIGILDPFVGDEEIGHLNPDRFEDAASLCTWADTVVIATPLTEMTRNLISTHELQLLGPAGVIVISSRGGIVNEEELGKALRAGTIASAGVDVFDPEPPSRDNPLFGLDNVVLTPHYGGHSIEAAQAMAQMVCEQVWALLNGGTAPVANQPWL